MLKLQNVSYTHPNKALLFDTINLTVNPLEKIALIGNNGVGKSILLKIIAKELAVSTGSILVDKTPYYIPQIVGQFNHLNVAEALGVHDKLEALNAILTGNTSEENFSRLQDDWIIEARCKEALAYWKLTDVDLSEKMANLSGGEKIKVFLAGIFIHQPDFILMDEPSNHLDGEVRQLLYDFITATESTLIVVTHDRKLLNLLETICELRKNGITNYGGNYAFYEAQKSIEAEALNQRVQNKAKSLRKAKTKERETVERQQKLDSRGKAKQEKAGVAKIMMNTLRNKAEASTSKLKTIHTEKISGIAKDLQELRSAMPKVDKMKFDFDDATLHRGKILITAKNINFRYSGNLLWKENLAFQITSGERISLKGKNGSGKTTLIRLIIGTLLPFVGEIYKAVNNVVYVDQDYSLLDNKLRVYEQAEHFNSLNSTALQEHEIKIRLNRFLFTREDWDKPCIALSGGEKMRLMLCCLTINLQAPDIIILDEPTNNLDIQNIEILTAAINEYKGALIVVSHDETFLGKINIEKEIAL